MKVHRPIPPNVVRNGPVLQNVDRDEQVDLLKFPVPRLHELDGGRYIGTDDLVIMRDPEAEWINAATYRSMVVCTENSNSDIMVMQSAKDRVGMDTSSSLNWARERRVLI
jgi:UbiD family decarboxylase